MAIVLSFGDVRRRKLGRVSRYRYHGDRVVTAGSFEKHRFNRNFGYHRRVAALCQRRSRCAAQTCRLSNSIKAESSVLTNTALLHIFERVECAEPDTSLFDSRVLPQTEGLVIQESILFLGPDDSPLIAWLRAQGEEVTQTSKTLSADLVSNQGYSFLISYGYRHILRNDILDLFPSKAINLHISYLPWNRGADPNFWSFVERTPKGVTIHYLDEGVDTGDIIVQEETEFDLNQDTLATSYEKLHTAIQDLFKQHWQDIKIGQNQRHQQTGEGSRHKLKDKEKLLHLLSDGWNTPISILNDTTYLRKHDH